MNTFLGLFVGIAIFVGSAALLAPASEPRGGWPNCQHGQNWCGAPEPDGCTGPCEYWENCGAQCGCKRIPGCTI